MLLQCACFCDEAVSRTVCEIASSASGRLAMTYQNSYSSPCLRLQNPSPEVWTRDRGEGTILHAFLYLSSFLENAIRSVCPQRAQRIPPRMSLRACRPCFWPQGVAISRYVCQRPPEITSLAHLHLGAEQAPLIGKDKPTPSRYSPAFNQNPSSVLSATHSAPDQPQYGPAA